MTTLPPVLVTGATGFLGRRLAGALLRRGRVVRLLHRPGRRAALADVGAAAGGGRPVPVEGDVTDEASLARAADGCEAVFHLAARVSRAGKPEEFERVNVGGLAAVLAAASRCAVPRVIYTSSFLALGPSDPRPGAQGPLDGLDETALRPGAPALDAYQASKHEAALLARAAAAGGAPVVTLFPGVVLGPGPLGESNYVTGLIARHLRGRLTPLPNGGRARWCLVHVDDAVDGHLAAHERAKPGSAYVLGGENLALRDVFARLEALTGRPAPRLSLPHPVPWLVGVAEEALEAAFGRPPSQLTRGVARVLRREWAFDSGRAARDLGWTARPVTAILEDTVRWLELAGHVPRGTLRAARGRA